MTTDSAEKGLMTGAGNIGEESYDTFHKAYEYIDLTPVPRAWTPEELAGKVLVSCKIARTGLEPFIDSCQPFDSFTDAQFFYIDEFLRKTADEGVHLSKVGQTQTRLDLEMWFDGVCKKCGAGVIEVVA